MDEGETTDLTSTSEKESTTDQEPRTVSFEEYRQLLEELQLTKKQLSQFVNSASSLPPSLPQTFVDPDGFARPISMKYSMLSKNKTLTIRKPEELSIPLEDSFEREKQLAQYLQRTLRELSRYKFRVKQLEEQNHKLATRPLAATDAAPMLEASPGVPLKRNSFTPKERDDDSDDSLDEDEKLRQDLDDKRDNWEAYLGTFDERGTDDEGDEEADALDSFTLEEAETERETEEALDYLYPSTEIDDFSMPKQKDSVLTMDKLHPESIVHNPMLRRGREREIAFGHDDVYRSRDDDLGGRRPSHQSAGSLEDSSAAIRRPSSQFGSSDNLSVKMEVNPLRRASGTRRTDNESSGAPMPVFQRTNILPKLTATLPAPHSVPVIDEDSDDDDEEEIIRRPLMRVDERDSDDEESDDGLAHGEERQESDDFDDEVRPEMRVFELVNEQNVLELQLLLRDYARVVRAVDGEGRTPLHIACLHGWVDAAAALLEVNAPVDATDSHACTPLHLTRSAEVVRLLGNEGANVNAQDNTGATPLLCYCRDEALSCVSVILAFGANPMLAESEHSRHCLHIACLLGNYNLLLMLANEAKVPLVVDEPDALGFTALHFAASGDRPTGEQLKMLMLLLDKGSDVKRGNRRGVTALHLICANRVLSSIALAEPMVELLISCGAQPNARDADGCTPIIVSVAYREWSLCRHLLEVGGDLNIPCSMSSSFLQGGNGINELGLVANNYDKKTLELMQKSDCTASDLLPKTPRYKLFGFIRALQTRIPGENRDRCMNCAESFAQNSFFFMGTGKHHCRHCHRVVCQTCSPNEVPRQKLPQFVQETYSESTMRICVVCYAVLIEMRDEEN